MKFYLLFLMFFFTSYSQANLIAEIPEASGICYAENSNTLFIANDEGRVFEIDRDGKILRKVYLGEYDLEGVECDASRGYLLFAVEKVDNILVVSQKTLRVQKEIDIKREFKGLKVLKKDRKNGLEGIALIQDKIYLSNQSKNRWPKPDPSVLIVVDSISIDKKKVSIKRVVDHGYIDIAGLSFYKGYLYMVSDSDNLLIKYDLKESKTIWKIELPDLAYEGVAFDHSGYIYFADDKGSIQKILFKELIERVK